MNSWTCRVVGSLVAFSLVGCYVPPTEAQLEENFTAHRATFGRLLAMATEDRMFHRISNGEIPPDGMSEDRFRAYKAVFKDLGVQNGANWGIPGYPDGFFVLSSTSVPIGAGTKMLGYVYSSVPIGPGVARLPISRLPFEDHRDRGHEASFRQLDGGWYLFYYVGW